MKTLLEKLRGASVAEPMQGAEPMQWLGFMVAAALTLLIAPAQVIAPAQGEEWRSRAADLQIVGDSTWAGGGWGGYHPIRMEVTNFGPERVLELRFKPHDGGGLPTVRRRLALPQNATARVTLPVPLVGEKHYGRLSVMADGRAINDLARELALGERQSGVPQPAVLVVTPDAVELAPLKQAMVSIMLPLAAAHAAGSGYGVHVTSPSALEGDLTAVSPALLPAGWIDYSGVDVVAVRASVFAGLPSDRRTALLDWVTAGGRLIVHDVQQPAASSAELARLLGPAAAQTTTGKGATDTGWTAASAEGRRSMPTDAMVQAQSLATGMPVEVIQDALMQFLPNAGNPGLGALDPGLGALDIEELKRRLGPLVEASLNAQGRAELTSTWALSPPPFAVRQQGFGLIAAVTTDLFSRKKPAEAADWNWLLHDLGGASAAFPVRYGISARDGDKTYLDFPIPGVKGVPTISFLALITLFTLVIGPVNYIYLVRQKKIARLVVTVPVIAAATTVLLFAYSAVAHGFSTKGRVRSVTLIDPQARTATTVARLALFSGLAPSQGLQFSQGTGVFPIHPPFEDFHEGTVDWTDTQALTGGWLPSRTRTQFLTVTRRDERGRLTVAPAGLALKVSNGLTVALSHLIVSGTDGRLWFGRDVPAGGDATLHLLTDADWASVRELAVDSLPAVPAGVDENAMLDFNPRFYRRWDRYQPVMSTGLLERHLSLLTGPRPEPGGATAKPASKPGEPESGETESGEAVEYATDALQNTVKSQTIHPLAGPRGFMAIAASDPGVDLGGLSVDERGSLHLVMGHW